MFWTADGGRRTADGGRQTADGGQKTEDRGQRTEGRGQRTARFNLEVDAFRGCSIDITDNSYHRALGHSFATGFYSGFNHYDSF
ncbi:hypothetical protein CYPRO_0801 [Cyclonatronum proteinivorum]|uniref:Uncharacterized protein n=1 Tax=Cyclonatronum proteinivorum TaxID=1457365 RepID=A0A345UHY1_9BACT|nr:hypothetical protein CYPRO_0801 [Cyclonatronum proteinivorum]